MVIIKAKKTFFLSFILGILSIATQASAQEINNVKSIENKYININSTKETLKEISTNITPYMKQKLQLYNIFLTDYDIYNIPQYTNNDKRVQGLTDYNNHQILVHNFKYNDEKNQKILLHELGHALDTYDVTDGSYYVKTGKYSKTNEFEQIFKTECSSLEKYADEYYFNTKIEEFFAESFAIYMQNPDLVKDKSPRLFKYMEDMSKEKSVNGWQKNKENRWYYLENNKLKVGWFKDKDGKWYYFSSSGEMMTNACIDGYSLSQNGAMID